MYPLLRSLLFLTTILVLLVACRALPTPVPTPTTHPATEELPASVAGEFDVNRGIQIEAVVQSPSLLSVTIRLLKPTDFGTLTVRQKLLTLDSDTITPELLSAPATRRETLILNNYDRGVSYALPNADMVTTIPYDPTDVTQDTLRAIPAENTFTFQVSLLPAAPNQAHALLLERTVDGEVVTRQMTAFKVSEESLVQ